MGALRNASTRAAGLRRTGSGRLALWSVIVAVAFVGTTALATGASHRVKFPSRCTNSVYRPHHFVAACGDAGLIVRKIHWRHYGFRYARGRGEALFKTCDPDCASGGFGRSRAKVRLYRRRHCANVGGFHFTKVRIKFLGPNAPGHPSVERFPFPCGILR